MNNEIRNNNDCHSIRTVAPFASVSALHSADPIACEGDGTL